MLSTCKKLVRAAAVFILTGCSAADVFQFVIDPSSDRKCEVVVPADAIPAEKTAARLLVRHLSRMLPGVSFQIVTEGGTPSGKRIYVGSTKALSAAGFDTSGWDVEDELVAARPEGLFVAGGRTRGARYAAADFLEALGVVVASDDTEYSPRLERIEWRRPDLMRRPAFRARYTATYPIRQSSLNEFNKYNGFRGGGEAMGGYAAYGKYGDCHTFVRYSKDLPADTPEEVFALVRGKRAVPVEAGTKAPICPTSPKTMEVFLRLLESDVMRSRELEKKGLPRPLYYEISMDDNLTICGCPSCVRAANEDGCYAGVMLRLVNGLARRLAELDPAARITMLVYQNTLDFPKNTRPEPNVLPRICVHDTEWVINVKAEAVEPITSAHNGEFRKIFSQWVSASKSFGVWEYWEYYTKGVFPYIAPQTYVENMRLYKSLGAENILVEIENEAASFFAFKNWLALKLMDDPSVSYDDLAGRFFAVYYGAAAKPMREYLDLLSNAVRDEAAKAPMGPRNASSYGYLNIGFFRRVYGLLAAAEAATGGDERSLRHVRTEYVAVDRSLLRRDKAHIAAALGLDRKRLVSRIRRNERQYLENVFKPRSEALKKRLTRLDDFLDGELIDAPIPPEVKGSSIFDYKYNSFYIGATTRLVDDPDALGGKAVEIIGGNAFTKDNPFHKLPLAAGTYNRLAAPDKRAGPQLRVANVPQDEKFHLYRIGRTPLVKGSAVWIHWTWHMQLTPKDAYTVTPDYESDVWVSIKVTGPAYVKGSSKPDGMFVDRIIIAR